MKLKLANDQSQLEFDENMDIKELDSIHNEYFLPLLKMVDELKSNLSDTLDIMSTLECDTSVYSKIEEEAIKLLEEICKKD